MIRIKKPSAVPAMLRGASRPTLGPRLRDALIQQANAGATSFTFRSATYGATSVKKALIVAQHKKCCFCGRGCGPRRC